MVIAVWIEKGYVKQYVPVIYLLLSNRTQFIYDMSLRWVREELSREKRVFSAKEVSQESRKIPDRF